ncbi:MAG TPA: PQQ-binding-like beta-propeller repeat protein [Burkholderiales bacterium]|nr:PQQ-binding-like beta-propeller repeat protein [Burkholderiales bacterium]
MDKAMIGLVLVAMLATRADAVEGPTQEELNHAADSTEWLLPNHDYAGVRYVNLDQVTPDNAAQLRPVCAFQGADFNRALNNPIVYGGVMYVTTLYSTFALNPATCKVKWKHEWKPKGKEGNGSIKNRGVAIKDGRLVRGTQDGWLFALDAETGKQLWELKAANTDNFEALSINPVIFEDLVIIGPSGSESGIKGWIGAFRLADGQPAWRFNTVPGDGEPGADTWGDTDARLHGGGGIWTTPALDVEKGQLYVAVGNPAPDMLGVVRPGTNLYTNSIVVLDARTGALVWHKQAVPHDTHDWDVPVTAPLFRAKLDGGDRDVVTLAAKDGLLRLVDRGNQEVLYTVPVTTRSNFEAEITEQGIYVCPGLLGGVEWSVPAYSPRLDMMVVPAVDWCGTFKKDEEARFVAGQQYMGGAFTYDPVDKSTGWLTAIKATTGEPLWKYHSARPMLASLTATSGDMLFTGELTGDFLAMDARSGEVKYRYSGGGSIIGGVISYAVDGKQYVAAVSGNAAGFWLGPQGSMTVTVFALP